MQFYHVWKVTWLASVANYKHILRNSFHTVEHIYTKLGTDIAGNLTTKMQEPAVTEHPAVSVASPTK